MIIYAIGILVALVVLGIGERFNNETKKVYIDKGYSWNKVLLYSNLFAILGGLIMIGILYYQDVPKELNPFLLPFAVTICTYITSQSFMTDLKVLMINRSILRVAYLSMYAISLYNVIANDLLRINWIALTIFTILLIVIFLFSSIGASDVRAIAVAMPFVISLGGYDGIKLFVVSLLLVALGMGIRNIIRDRKKMKEFKESNMEYYKTMNRLLFYKLARDFIRKGKTEAEMATPVGPYMISPFLIYLFVYPFLF